MKAKSTDRHQEIMCKHNIFLQPNYNKIPIIIIKYIFKFNLSFCYNRTTQNNSKKREDQFKRQDKKNNNII